MVLLGLFGCFLWLQSAGGLAGAQPAGPAGLLSTGHLVSSRRLNQASAHGGSSIQEAWQALLKHLSSLCVCYTC